LEIGKTGETLRPERGPEKFQYVQKSGDPPGAAPGGSLPATRTAAVAAPALPSDAAAPHNPVRLLVLLTALGGALAAAAVRHRGGRRPQGASPQGHCPRRTATGAPVVPPVVRVTNPGTVTVASRHLRTAAQPPV